MYALPNAQVWQLIFGFSFSSSSPHRVRCFCDPSLDFLPLTVLSHLTLWKASSALTSSSFRSLLCRCPFMTLLHLCFAAHHGRFPGVSVEQKRTWWGYFWSFCVLFFWSFPLLACFLVFSFMETASDSNNFLYLIQPHPSLPPPRILNSAACCSCPLLRTEHTIRYRRSADHCST